MERTVALEAGADGQSCPHLRPARADWIYPVAGYCRGLPGGLLMIPTVEEYRTFCSTHQYGQCLMYRYRQGDRAVESLLRASHCPLGRFSPLEGLFGSPGEVASGLARRAAPPQADA